MQTKPNQADPVDPQLLDTVLRALLEDEATLPGIARRLSMSLADLLAFIEIPEVQRTLARLRTVMTQRAELIAITSETAALQNLVSVGKDLDEIAEEQRSLDEEAADLDSSDKAAIVENTRARKLNAQRSKDRIESARAARASLSHARTRTSRAHEALPQALKLTMPIEEFEQAS
ncbi:MAG: hypothetical protein ACNA8P_02480 [Phycisphaerales bacterium]